MTGIGESAETKYRSDYEIKIGNQKVLMGPHLRRCTGSPVEILRIYWYVDDATKQIFVGHVGRKLRDQSNPRRASAGDLSSGQGQLLGQACSAVGQSGEAGPADPRSFSRGCDVGEGSCVLPRAFRERCGWEPSKGVNACTSDVSNVVVDVVVGRT